LKCLWLTALCMLVPPLLLHLFKFLVLGLPSSLARNGARAAWVGRRDGSVPAVLPASPASSSPPASPHGPSPSSSLPGGPEVAEVKHSKERGALNSASGSLLRRWAENGGSPGPGLAPARPEGTRDRRRQPWRGPARAAPLKRWRRRDPASRSRRVKRGEALFGRRRKQPGAGACAMRPIKCVGWRGGPGSRSQG